MAKFYSLKAKFIIRDETTPCIFYRNRKWSLKFSINNPLEFDCKEGKLTSLYKGKDKDEINFMIQQRYQLINRLISEAFIKGDDSLVYIDTYFEAEKEKLQKLNIDVNTKISDGFFEYLKNKGYDEEERDEKKKKEIKKKFDRYLSELSRLKDFETKNKTRLGGLNLKWVEKFAKFLATPYDKETERKNELYDTEYTTTNTYVQTNATIQRFIQDIVSFLKYTNEGQPELKFDLAGMRAYANSLPLAHEDIDNITVLTREQWADYKEFQPNPKLKHEVRSYDLFRFACNVGMRYSDCVRLNDDYIIIDKKDRTKISMKAQKTQNSRNNGKFEVLMNPDALKIYNKYGRDFRGKFPSSQQINKNLRKLWKRIPSFQHKVINYVYVLHNMTEDKIFFYDKLSFHDSRKSFASWIVMQNSKGDAIQNLMKYLGWNDMRTIKHYLNVFGNDTSDSDEAALYMI